MVAQIQAMALQTHHMKPLHDADQLILDFVLPKEQLQDSPVLLKSSHPHA